MIYSDVLFNCLGYRGVAGSSHNIWHKVVPLKINLFAWCLFQNRIPTSCNLLRRGLLQNQQHLCVGGCGCNEDINHLFSHCNFFGLIITSQKKKKNHKKNLID